MGFLSSVAGGLIGGNLLGGDDDAPEAPAAGAVAGAQAKANQETARLQALLNRFNQTTPQGSLSWTQDPNNKDLWTSTVTLSPKQQRLFNKNQRASGIQADLVNRMLRGAGGDLTGTLEPGAWNLSTPESADTTRRAITDALYEQMTSRLDPQFEQYQSQMENRLANQGITQGSSANTSEWDIFNRGRNDAYQSAMNSAITEGEDAYYNMRDQNLQERTQRLGEQKLTRDQILNELNALRTGSQMTPPTFMGQNPSVDVAQTPIAQAMQNQYLGDMDVYNAKMGTQNALMQGLTQAGAMWLMS